MLKKLPDLCLVIIRLEYPVGFAVAKTVAKNAGKDFSDPALASDLLQFFKDFFFPPGKCACLQWCWINFKYTHSILFPVVCGYTLYVLYVSQVVICSKNLIGVFSWQSLPSIFRGFAAGCPFPWLPSGIFQFSVFFFPLPLGGLIYYYCCNSWKGHVLVLISWLPREELLLQNGNAPLLHLGTRRGKSVSCIWVWLWVVSV